ncbi:MAG: glycoside hydrolase 43 family protein [Acidobacteriota bacterium]|nr:glycoside hydrolase 43 family protein [Acidobacteriota bacterium]
MRRAVAAAIVLCAAGMAESRGQAPVAPRGLAVTPLPDAPSRGLWGDQADGSYVNPVLPADFSDLDAIAVGTTFYAISSTMQYSPGMTVLQSDDLVNWRVLGGVVPDLTVLDPELNWDRMNRAGRGIWAGAIRFHAGRFWVYFATPDQGIYMSTATTPAGPWTAPAPVMTASGWDDTCPFWDDDGQMYLVTSHTSPEGPSGTKYNIHLFRLTPDGRNIVPGSDRIIHQSRGSEANKLYKWNGLYYHYFSEVRPEGRVAMMERARSLDGPWEVRQLQHVQGAVDKEPNQGGIVQSPDGRWWFFTHQGRGDWEGRAAVLLPVEWIDGWPVIGRPGADGIGTMVWRGEKPVQGRPRTEVVASDDFTLPVLRPEWQWNYQPRGGMWSLAERRGFLRLHAFAPVHPDALTAVGNVLTQRAFRSAHNEVTVKLDLSGMTEGQEAGLSHFAKTSAAIGVVQTGEVRALSVRAEGRRIEGPVLKQKQVWLRSAWGFDGVSRFAYSLDGRTFTPLGPEYQLTWGSYRGDRIGLYTWNSSTTGYADFTQFVYKVAH